MKQSLLASSPTPILRHVGTGERLSYSQGNQAIMLEKTQAISEVLSMLLEYPYPERVRGGIIERFGYEAYASALRLKVLSSKSKMTFDDFREFPFIWNNLRLYFYPGTSFASEGYKNQVFYKRFVRENPQLNLLLLGYVQSMGNTSIPENQLRKFYEAYTIMLGYEEVTSNDHLLH